MFDAIGMPNKVLNRGAGLSVFFATLALGLTIYLPVGANEAPIFENVTIGRKFSPDPMTVRGISGGSVTAQQVAGRGETPNGPCVGFVDDKPDHTLVLTDDFEYLKLQLQSPGDTTIVVKGTSGTWCNDDFSGKNAGIAGQWLKGTYGIWVGSYNRTQYIPYSLQITEVR
jgi:hypothetical protein